MLAHDYATALAHELKNGKELSSVLSSLDRVLQKKGHEKLRLRILRELSHLFERGESGSATLTVSKEEDVKQFEAAIKKAEQELGVESGVERRVDSSLVGGFILATKDRQIDRSYKRALVNLYRSIVTKN